MRVFVLVVLMFFRGHLWAGWAEETLQHLSLQEKIGQLFVIPATSQFEALLLQTIDSYHIGAVLMKQTPTLAQHIALLEALQARSKLPLLCAGDAEYGLAMRIKELLPFPKNLALGAIQDRQLLYAFGKMVGEHCKLVGLHLNLAPVVDVNGPSGYPVMGMRSFGDDPDAVSIKASLVISGMQEAGTLACAKHFPGHGSVSVDSHKAMPTISSSLDYLKKVDFAPFKQAINQAHVAAIMSGHLAVPALDKEAPASLSFPIITNLLKEEWGFEGLVITDALEMRALSTHYTTEEIAVGAFMAGHDLLLYGSDHRETLEEVIPLAFSAIEQEVVSGRISETELDARVLKVLCVKEKLGLHQSHPNTISCESVMEHLHSKKADDLRCRLYREATFITNNNSGLIPAGSSEYVKLWEGKGPSKRRGRSTLVVGVNHPDQFPELCAICRKNPRVIVAFFLPPYLLQQIPAVTTVVGYELCAESERAVWESITRAR